MEAEARDALRLFERARAVAERAHYEFAAWYVAGNIERLEIVLGRAGRAVRPIRRRLGILQARGATYDEIVARSNLAWGLRTLGRHREALHELDVALQLARETGTFNVLLEFLRVRSLDRARCVGRHRGLPARAIGAICSWWEHGNRKAQTSAGRRIQRHPDARSSLSFSSARTGSSSTTSTRHSRWRIWQALQGELANAARSVQRLSRRHPRGPRPQSAARPCPLALAERTGTIAEIAARYGFRSATTFAIEYRKRYGGRLADEARAQRRKPRRAGCSICVRMCHNRLGMSRRRRMTPGADAAIRPFRLAVDAAAIADLATRLARVRWPDEAPEPPWSYGTSVGFMRELVDYWAHAYDWRRTEAALNAWPQFVTRDRRHRRALPARRGPRPQPEAAAAVARLARVGARIPEADSAADRSGGARRRRRGRLHRRRALAAGVHAVVPREPAAPRAAGDRRDVSRAHDAARLRALRRPGRRLGLVRHRVAGRAPRGDV